MSFKKGPLSNSGEEAFRIAKAMGGEAIVGKNATQEKLTKDLMLLFYKNLKKGQTKDAALREAKLRFIAQNTHPMDIFLPFFYLLY